MSDKEYWNNLTSLEDKEEFELKFCKDESFYRNFVCPCLVKAGAIPKSKLKDNAIYKGFCRNSSIATWHADQNCFIYQRTKFGDTFPEKILHYEDDMIYDVFIPIKQLENEER